jgi:hypothetical protein
MIIKCYEEIFKVTETLQNGKERTIKKSVLCPIFRNGKHIIYMNRIDEARGQLLALHYYHIEHIESKYKEIIATDNLEVERGL